MSNKRILTTSIISWSDTSGDDTLPNFFDGYGAENVANIFVRGDNPTSMSCDNYFRICEAAVLKSIFKRNIKTGEISNRTSILKAGEYKKEQKRYFFFRKYRLFAFLLLRELCWKFGKWKSEELDRFIEDFKPDILFCTAEPYIYMNRINLYIAKKTGAKVISVIWDDNFTYKSCAGFSDRFFRFFVKRQVKELISISNRVISISPKTKKEADAAFGIDSVIITKSVSPSEEKNDAEYHFPLKLLYAGNFYIGRDKSIKLLSEQIKKLNKETHYFDFDIYVNNAADKKNKGEDGYTKIFNRINKSELAAKICESDILVFAESLGKRYAHAARLSFSSKITDYLGSGKAILAIGKPDIAAMEYFADNNAALCASTEEEIPERLGEIIKNPELLKEYAERARLLGTERHSKEKTVLKLREIIDEL